MATRESLVPPDAARSHVRSIGTTLTGDVTEVTSCQWRWLFDLRRGLFTRCSRAESLERALQFGTWRRLQHVRVLSDDRLEVKEVARPAIRTSLHGANCDCSTPMP
jgi:hypothetical protein